MKNIFLLSVFIYFFLFTIPSRVIAQNNNPEGRVGQPIYEGKIIKVIEEKQIDVAGVSQLYQKLEVLVTKGDKKETRIIIENGDLPIINLLRFKQGDQVKFTKTEKEGGGEIFYILDYVRRNAIYRLFIIFLLFVLAIARWRGITSIVGMFVSYAVIINFIIPQIISGHDPIKTTIVGSIIIVPVIYYLSHGFNRKSTAAILGTSIAMIATGILTGVFANAAKLTGLSSEESGFLQLYSQGALDIKGLLYSGILIGALGVMDDITISQASIVTELKKLNPKITFTDLYKRAMVVGQDHIASMVNTLVLVYTGASLPLLLLFVKTQNSFEEIIDFEIVAEEIIRTLVGSIGLILAVPITTLIIAFLLRKK